MNYVTNEIIHFLEYYKIENSYCEYLAQLLIILFVVLVSFLITKLFRHIIIPLSVQITSKTKAKWDDYIFNEKTLKTFYKVIPPIVWYLFIPSIFIDMPKLTIFLQKVCEIYIIIVVLRFLRSVFLSLYGLTNEKESMKNKPIKGIYQMLELILFIIGVILIISIITNSNATRILTGLGASAAVLMLIFKDTILGLVAGVQLLINDMVRPGDWITMHKYGVDGDVLEVTLTTVKIRNFDKTIVTIPPYALISDSFQNWRGMYNNEGRRIKRSINIDTNTVRLFTKEEIEKLKERGFITDEQIDNCHEIINLTLFRHYITQYLNQHPNIRHDLVTLVRELQPSSEGMPIEIYCFTNTTLWIPYEEIQCGIFDHIMATANVFGLKIFQHPTGSDFEMLSTRNTKHQAG